MHDSLRLDWVNRRVLEQVVHIVVVDLHKGGKQPIAAVLIHHILNLAALRNA